MAAGEKKEKFSAGPTLFRPGPTLDKQVSVAVMAVTRSLSRMDSSKVPTTAMNSQMARFAEQALDDVPPEWREITGITMGLSQQSYTKVLGALDSCRKKILDIVVKEENVDRVYRLNLQMFPMTTIESDKVNDDNT